MNTAWLRQALVGVDGPPAFAADGAIGELFVQVAAGDADHALAFGRAAGIHAACRLSAVLLDPPCDEAPDAAPPDPNAMSTRHAWSEALASVFAEGPARLEHEACLRIAAIRAVLPPPLLPPALDAGRRNQPVRAVLASVIGHRGRWLARFNDDWRFAIEGTFDAAAADDARMWEEGSLAQRVGFLRSKRRSDPAGARELLRAQWKELPAKERLDMLAALEQDLSADDEVFLDPILKDRSRDVRVAAADLLARLPASAHARRLNGWIEPLLAHKRSLLRKTWTIDAPPQADPAWPSAAIEPARPQHDPLGERAWWLYQIVRQLPLAWWVAHTGMQPAELLAWADKTDWKAALYRGWLERVGATDRDWIAAILHSEAPEFRAHRPTLLSLLPVGEREKYWPRSLETVLQQGVLGTIIAACAPGETLSQEYSHALAAGVHGCFASDRVRNDYVLRAQLLELAAILHPQALPPCQSMPRRDDETPSLAETIHGFERIIAIRRTLHTNP